MADQNAHTSGANSEGPDPLDFGLRPLPGYQDRDAQMAEVLAAHAATPNEAYAQAEVEMRAELQKEGNLAIVGEGRGVAHIVDDPQVFDKLSSVDPTKDARTAIAEAAGLAESSATHEAAMRQQLAAGETSGALDASTAAASGAQSDSSKGPASSPLELEQTISAIRMSAERDRRFVISGDPNVQTAFYARLEAMGKLKYQGGTQIIGVSHAKAVEILKLVAKEQGAEFRPALKMEFLRDSGDGIMARSRDGIANLLGRHNSVEVFVVGDAATVEKKLGEIGQLVEKLDKAGFIPSDKKPPLEGGSLKLDGGQPYEFRAERSMDRLVADARNTVGAYNRETVEAESARKDFRNKELDAKIAKASAESGTDSSSAAPGKPTVTPSVDAKDTAVRPFIKDLQTTIDESTSRLGGLSEKHGKQLTAEKLLDRVQNLNGKDVAEVAKLPDSDRQKMVAQLAVIAAKVDSGAFGKQLTAERLDTPRQADPANDKAGAPSIREKLTEMISAEKARDPQFDSRAADVLVSLEKSGVVTREQAEKAYEALAPGKELPAVTKDAAPHQDAPAEQAAGKASEQAVARADSAEPNPKQSDKEAPAPAATQGDTLAKAPEAAAVAAEAPLAGTASPATTLKQQELFAAESGAPQKDGVTSSQAAPAQDVEKPTPQAAAPTEKANPLVDKLDAMAKSGPDSLTREDASALLATLDGRRTSKLASLDSRSGDGPTQTLAHIEAVLNEAAKGRLGDDLKASAIDLRAALDKWKSQDVERTAGKPAQAAEGQSDLRTSTRAPDGAAAEGQPAAPRGSSQATQSGNPHPEGSSGQAPNSSPTNSSAPGAQTSDAAKAEAAERYTRTELAAGKLATLMANPAGSFTNRDKSWNDRNVTAAAEAVMRIDVSATQNMTANQRTQIAAYAAWMADKANSGNLPGFDGPVGKARAEELTQHATELIRGATGKMPAGVATQLTKADRMVSAMGQRTRGQGTRFSAGADLGSRASSRTPMATPAQRPQVAQAAPALDGARLAKDIGHAVFKSKELGEAFAKHLLKNGGALSAESLKTLTPDEKAQAVVGLAQLAQDVRNGALGDFKTLNPTLQRQVVQAAQTANKLQAGLSADPSTQLALTKAHLDLREPDASSQPKQPGNLETTGGPGKAGEKTLEKPTSAASPGRSLDR